MNTYFIAHGIHLTTVLATFLLFLLRGAWMLLDSPLLGRRWVRVLPHVVDTVLLLSALHLAVVFYQYPMVHQPWITAKIVGLLAYIALGMLALRRGRSKAVRAGAFAAAIAVFAYIVAVALSKSPWPLY